MCDVMCFILVGLYCSGWVKTGPVGVILNTMDNAFETAETILTDYSQGGQDLDECSDHCS